MSPNLLVWKFYGNRAFAQNFYTRKLSEITGFVNMLCSEWESIGIIGTKQVKKYSYATPEFICPIW